MLKKGLSIFTLTILTLALGSVMLVAGAGAPVTSTTIYVEPKLVKNEDLHFEVGDTFPVDIMISNVENLYAWGLYLGYSPIKMVLDCVGASGQKEFLGKTGLTVFVPPAPIDVAAGTVYISACLLGAVPGVSGDGKLATVTFKVMEAGKCALDLYDTKLIVTAPNPTPPPENILVKAPHNVVDGYYAGPFVELAAKLLPLGRDRKVCENQIFNSSVKNFGDVPLYAKVKFHMIRDDSKIIDLWTPTKVVEPGKVLVMPPVEIEHLTTADIGTYHCEAIAYFSFSGAWYNKGTRTSTFKWWVSP